jgi:hypothetical protein
MSTMSRKVNPVTGLTMADCAFLEAYNRLKSGPKAYAELHPDANEKTATNAAKAILTKPAVSAYLAKVQQQAQIAAGCSLAEHLNALAVLRNLAMKEKRYRDAIYAEELRGKASGHYKVDVHLHGKLTHEFVKAVDLSVLNNDELEQLRAGDISDSLFARLRATADVPANSSGG